MVLQPGASAGAYVYRDSPSYRLSEDAPVLRVSGGPPLGTKTQVVTIVPSARLVINQNRVWSLFRTTP